MHHSLRIILLRKIERMQASERHSLRSVLQYMESGKTVWDCLLEILSSPVAVQPQQWWARALPAETAPQAKPVPD